MLILLRSVGSAATQWRKGFWIPFAKFAQQSKLSNVCSMEIDVKTTGDGILLPVQAQPGARRNEIIGIHNGRLKVAVTQVAEKGKANRELIKLLAKSLGVAKSQVTLVAGTTSSRKSFLISGVNLQETRRRLGEILGSR
jgi:uncharacterized protein